MKNLQPKYYAFFDVDGTLVNQNTMQDFLKFYYQEKFSSSTMLGSIVYRLSILKLKLFLLCGKKREFLNNKYYRSYKNQNIYWIKKLGEIWFDRNLKNNPNSFITSCVNELKEHQKKGAEVVFVSGSFGACLDPIAQHLGVKHILATKMEIKGDRYTGIIIPPQTIGNGKAESIQQFLKENSFNDYKNCYAYGDHCSDIPMLSLVGNPRVVAGDTSMEKYAQKFCWKIINPNL